MDNVIPGDVTTDLVSFSILLDGNEMDMSYQVLSIQVEHEFNRIPQARIVISDGDPANQEFPEMPGLRDMQAVCGDIFLFRQL